jgi:hypothetical protein
MENACVKQSSVRRDGPRSRRRRSPCAPRPRPSRSPPLRGPHGAGRAG